MSYDVQRTSGPPKTFFASNGVKNPPKLVTPVNHLGSKMSRSGFRLLPSETAIIPKTVSIRGGRGRKNILNPRINIRDEAFDASLTYMDSDRVRPPVPTEPLSFTRKQPINSGPIRMKKVRKTRSRKKTKN